MTKLQTNGLGLLEVLIVIAILGILIILVINPFTSFRSSQALSGTAEEILSVLQQARVKTLTAEGGNQYGVHFSSSQVIVFVGGTYNSGSPTNLVTNLNSLVTISGINLAGGGLDVVFQKLTGETSQSGAVVVSLIADAARTKTVTINSNGISDVD